jgi:hypothetical protein
VLEVEQKYVELGTSLLPVLPQNGKKIGKRCNKKFLLFLVIKHKFETSLQFLTRPI